MSTHNITAEEYARVVAKVYEPLLDWDKPSDFDLLDRKELTATAGKILDALACSGFVIQRIDDLALDEFDLPPRSPEPGHYTSIASLRELASSGQLDTEAQARVEAEIADREAGWHKFFDRFDDTINVIPEPKGSES